MEDEGRDMVTAEDIGHEIVDIPEPIIDEVLVGSEENVPVPNLNKMSTRRHVEYLSDTVP